MANRQDTFNRANASGGLGTPSDGGSDWVELASNFGIFGNQAYGAGGGSPTVSYLECGAGSGDGTIQVTHASVGGNAGVAFRISDADNLFAVWVIGGQFSLYRRQSGSNNLLGQASGTATSGDVVSAVLSDDSITIKVNGTTKITVTDAFQKTATKHGLATASADTSSLLDDWSFTGGTPAQLAQADPSVTVTSDTTISLTAPASTGGAAPYSYQWKRATAANGSYSNVGTNSTSLGDSSGLSAGTTYWYTVTATDSAGSPQTATSSPVPAKLSGKAFKVRVIGDSHWTTPDTPTGGTNQAPAEFVARLGAWLNPRAVSLGGNSAFGGAHSADWIPGASGTPLETAVSDANTSGDNLYVIELASNDATNGGNPPVSAATYLSNMTAIVNYIRANATGTPLTIVLLHPFYFHNPSGTPAGFDLPTSLEALWSYRAQLESLADNVTVYTVGMGTGYQIVTAQSAYLYTDKLHLSNPDGQKLSADLAAMDFAGKLQFAGTGGSGVSGARIFGGF